MATKKKLNVVDLFCGAGGFSLAAQQSGMNVVFAVESDKWAATTYRENFCSRSGKNTPMLYEDDIRNLDPESIHNKHFKDTHCDLLLGGPPCQGFSSHRLYSSASNDQRNSLIHNYFAFVKSLKPRLFLMENVPGMLWSRHKNNLEEFYHAAHKSDYNVLEPITINAKNYGVPQNRKRVFILGLSKYLDFQDMQWPPKNTHGKKNNKSALPTWVSCRNAFKRAPIGDKNNVHMKHTKELVELFNNTPLNGSRLDSGRTLPCHVNHTGHKDVYGRINQNLPAPTMTTACVNPSKGRFVHPTQNHGITVRQAARIQTFPDDFMFFGGLTASAAQVGNAVPVLLGKILICHLKNYLIEQDTIEKQYNSLISAA